MECAPIPVNELERLSVLRSLKVLDTPPDPIIDDAVHLAKAIAKTEIAVVSLVDAERQWFKACVGLDAQETPRGVAFCAHAILNPGVLWVADATEDSRFASNPLVTGPPNIRFYAGAVIVINDQPLGTICVISAEPRPFDQAIADQLQILARMVSGRLAERLLQDVLTQIVGTNLEWTA